MLSLQEVSPLPFSSSLAMAGLTNQHDNCSSSLHLQWSFILRLFVCLIIPSLAYSKCAFPAVFNFGDSTSDTGGIHAAFPFTTAAESPPYGSTFFNRPVQRYSDGRLLIDFLMEGFDEPYLSPYLQSVDSNFSQGANFAVAGATARKVSFISPFSLDIQVNQFKVFKQKVLETISLKGPQNTLPPANVFTQALYIIEIGGNDFSYAYMNLKMTTSQINMYIPQVVDAIGAAIKALYAEGGRTIWVMGVGPQGCIPFFLTKFPHSQIDLDSYGCASPFNNAVLVFNNLLQTELRSLESDLLGSTIVYVDTFDIVYQMVQNPARFGFQEAIKACCGVGGEYNYAYGVQCGSNATIRGQFLTALPCADPGAYLNWDGVHLTDQANRLLAQYILSGSGFEPPFPLASLCDLKPI